MYVCVQLQLTVTLQLPDVFAYTDWHPFKWRTAALVQLSPGVIEPVISSTALERR